jgi:hypothetical protein
LGTRHLLLACLVLALLIAAFGCGGGDMDTGGGPEAEIDATIRALVLSDDPAKCTENATQALVEERSPQTGKAALEECREDAGRRWTTPRPCVCRGSRSRGRVRRH